MMARVHKFDPLAEPLDDQDMEEQPDRRKAQADLDWMIAQGLPVPEGLEEAARGETVRPA